MKIPTKLLYRILLDVGLQISDTIEKDYTEMCSRYEREGMSFLTITLPTLDDALLRGLTRGRLLRSDYVGFRSYRRHGSLPALLSGFFRRIFHDDGLIMDEPDICAISAIRQVTRLFKKVELPCSEPRIKAAYERYQSNDEEVSWRRHRFPFDGPCFRAVTGYLWAGLERLSGELYCFPGVFGPGATAERLKRNERFTITQWPKRAEGSFPSSYYTHYQEFSDTPSGVSYLSDSEEPPVRVVQVPKTLKTPRTISVEPSFMMLMQQSIAKPLMVYLESKRFGFKSIRFVDQSVNRDLARRGSLDGSLATIDLKDASDLVDLDLVREIFRGPCPTFLNLIEDCRTTRAMLPCGTYIPLRKFASMGSALCFPIESMVFFTIVLYAIVKSTGKVPSRRLLRRLADDVAIYGDDIIVKSSMAPVVMDTLEDFGLKVNRDKSFHTGLFRESCGGDYYKGVDVTPAYVRQWDETGTMSSSSHKVAYVSLSNTFYMKGLWHACQYLRDGLRKYFKRDLPLAQHPIGVLHYSSFIRSSNLLWDSKLHGYCVKGYRVKVPSQDDSPLNISGFLGLAFGSRYFRDSLREFQDSVCCEPDEGHALLSREEWIGGIGNDANKTFRSFEVRGFRSDSDTPGEPGSELGSQSYAELLRTGSSSIHGTIFHDSKRRIRGTLGHLTTVQSTSMYTSERPHSLSLKSGRTASPAGLAW